HRSGPEQGQRGPRRATEGDPRHRDRGRRHVRFHQNPADRRQQVRIPGLETVQAVQAVHREPARRLASQTAEPTRTTPTTKMATGVAADMGRYLVVTCGVTIKTPRAPSTASQAWRSSTPPASRPATVARASA